MKRFLSLCCALLLCLALLPAVASADMGPKPAVFITVKNAPEGPYYLDLLITHDKEGGYHDNMAGRTYDRALLTGLHAWEAEGWYPAFAGGTTIPLFGDLVPDAEGVHRFSYYGLPDTFRIAVSTAHGSRATAAAFTRTEFYTYLSYDYADNTLTVLNKAPGLSVRFRQFMGTFLPTLVLEGLLLVMFDFSTKRNWLVFFLVNLITQLGLHLAIGGGLLGTGAVFERYLLLALPAEAVIWGAEAVAYALLLQGHSKPRRVLYALSANALSFFGGFLVLQGVLTRLSPR